MQKLNRSDFGHIRATQVPLSPDGEKTVACVYCQDKKFVYFPLPASGEHRPDIGKAWPCPKCSMVPDGAGGFRLYTETSKGQSQVALMRSLGCEI